MEVIAEDKHEYKIENKGNEYLSVDRVDIDVYRKPNDINEFMGNENKNVKYQINYFNRQ